MFIPRKLDSPRINIPHVASGRSEIRKVCNDLHGVHSGKIDTSHSPRIQVNVDGPLMLNPGLQVKLTVSPSTNSVPSVMTDFSGLTPWMENLEYNPYRFSGTWHGTAVQKICLQLFSLARGAYLIMASSLHI